MNPKTDIKFKFLYMLVTKTLLLFVGTLMLTFLIVSLLITIGVVRLSLYERPDDIIIVKTWAIKTVKHILWNSPILLIASFILAFNLKDESI